jgi:hypothetical protein
MAKAILKSVKTKSQRQFKIQTYRLDGDLILIQHVASDPARPWHIYAQENVMVKPAATVITRRTLSNGQIRPGPAGPIIGNTTQPTFKPGQCRLLARFRTKREAMSFYHNPTLGNCNLTTTLR